MSEAAAAGVEPNAIEGVELDVILTGEGPLAHGYIYRASGNRLAQLIAGLRPGGETLTVPCLAFVVRHPSAGTILVDTGFHRAARESMRQDFGVVMGLLFRQLRPSQEPFDRQLEACSIEPATVQRVVMTHLHVDHTSGMRLLPNAEFVCSREEWKATQGRFPAAGGYAPRHLASASRMRLLDFERDGKPYATFTRAIDLLGDGSIRLLSTPGHTAGHISVLLQPAQGPRVLLIGDAAYTLRSVSEGILPLITTSDRAALRSLAEIRAFAAGEPDAILVPTHDPVAWKQLNRSAKA
ncbi:MAG TPA: N-acyl homoserine lactonase family protein [Solirubrobacteraceae bacterium]|jgi:glyoxylase-like metal-dependent hydrolase (beta-lactamase superfamily II)